MAGTGRSTIVFCAVVVLILICIAVFYFWPESKQTNIVPNEIIETNPTDISGTQDSVAQTLSDVTEAEKDSPIPQNTPTKVSISTGLQIKIVDAIGDPIPGGILDCDGTEYSFQNGVCTITPAIKGRHSLTVRADGYETVSKDIDVKEEESLTVTMEYLISLQFVVYNDPEMRKPISDAEIVLWKGPSVQRPIFKETSLNMHSFTGGDYKITFQEKDGTFHIIGVNANSSDQKEIPQPGDRLTGVSAFALEKDDTLNFPLKLPRLPLLNDNSRRLRIWDALVYYSGNAANTEIFDDKIEFEKEDSSKFMDLIWRVPKPAEQKIIASKMTDKNGMCRFDDLSAGTFFAQASKNEKYCPPYIIHPARGGAEFYMNQTGEKNMGKIDVHVQLSASGTYRMSRDIEGSKVILTPEKGFQTSNTDRSGRVTFESVSWGECTIKVLPTGDVPFSPITQKFNFQEQNKTITIFVESGFDIKGKVVREDTKTPVPNFGLLLFFKNTNETISAKRVSPGMYGETITSEEGSFIFPNTRPGEYFLTALNESDFIGCFQGESDDPSETIDSVYTYDSRLNLQVLDRSLEEIVYKVLPRVKTRFRGVVKTPDGEFLPGAKIEIGSIATRQIMGVSSLFFNKLNYTKEGATTDERGSFDITVFTTPSRRFLTKEITAKIEEEIKYPPNSISNISSLPNKPFGMSVIKNQGSTTVHFQTGDTVENILIVVDETDYYEITGKITTEDGIWPITTDPLGDDAPPFGVKPINGKWPVEVQLSGSQKHYHNIPGDIDPMGNYRIRIPEKDRVNLIVDIIFPFSSNTFTKEYIPPYCSISVPVENKDGLKVVNKDIVLKIAGYFSGRVVNEKNYPLENISVKAFSPGVEYPILLSAVTDENGYFMITNVQKGLEYNLQAIYPGEENPSATIERLKPTLDNIILQVSEPTSQ